MIYKIIFKGRVQGVGFRYRAKQIADKLGLAGSVRNLYNYDVEVYISGSEDKIDQFIDEISNQSFIRIESYNKIKVDKNIEENVFQILY